jgi:hypothetical protein
MTNPLADSEIVLHALRLARSGNYKTFDSWQKALYEDFPKETKERLNECLATAANTLLLNLHQHQ